MFNDGPGGSPTSREGALRSREWDVQRREATKALGYDPVSKMRRNAVGFAVKGLGTVVGLPVAGSPMAFAGIEGLSHGVGDGISSGNVAEGVKSGLLSGASAYGVGRLYKLFPKTTISLGTGSSGYGLHRSISDYGDVESERQSFLRDTGLADIAEKAISDPAGVTPSEWSAIKNNREQFHGDMQNKIDSAYSRYLEASPVQKWDYKRVYTPGSSSYMDPVEINNMISNWDSVPREGRFAFAKEVRDNMENISSDLIDRIRSLSF